MDTKTIIKAILVDIDELIEAHMDRDTLRVIQAKEELRDSLLALADKIDEKQTQPNG